MASADAQIVVEVVYALENRQHVCRLILARGTTAGEAVEMSGLAKQAGGAAPPLRLACFGRLIPGNRALEDGDRVEILRPLKANPKEWRRLRARVQARRSAKR